MHSDKVARERARLVMEQGINCHYCTRETNREIKSLFPVVEHFIPESREKEFGAKKLVLACAWCDRRKGMMHGVDYLIILHEEVELRGNFIKAQAFIKKRCKKINDAMHLIHNSKIIKQREQGLIECHF